MKRASSAIAPMIVAAVLLHTAGIAGQQAPPSAAPTVPEPLPISGSASAGSVTTTQTVAPGTSGGNTLAGSVQIQGAFQGSTPTGVASREALPLGMGEAIRRGLAYNLGVIGATELERDARAGQ